MLEDVVGEVDAQRREKSGEYDSVGGHNNSPK